MISWRRTAARRSRAQAQGCRASCWSPPRAQEVVVSVRPSSDNGDPGEIAVGYFVVVDGAVQPRDENGKPLKDAKPEVLADGVNPRSIAARMTRARWERHAGRV
jgi:hypothetical protein